MHVVTDGERAGFFLFGAGTQVGAQGTSGVETIVNRIPGAA